MTIRIVVDTSVFISALIGPQGPSRKLIRQSLLGRFQVLMGDALYIEYESVMNRPSILAQCPLEPEEMMSLLEAFMSVTEWTSIYYKWRPNLKDEGDNHLIELAVAGNADFVVTNNLKDFRNTELLFPQLEVLKPDDIIRRF